MRVDESELYRIAALIREAMKESIYDIPCLRMRIGSFPSGCCGYASEQIGLKIKEHYPSETVLWVNAQDAEFTPHTWIEFQNRIIDITPDQFVGIKEPIIVCEKHQSKLHESFCCRIEIREIQPTDILTDEEKLLKEYVDKFFCRCY